MGLCGKNMVEADLPRWQYNTAHAHCIPDNWGHTDTSEYVTFLLSRGNNGKRTRLSITLIHTSAVLHVIRDEESGYGMQLNRPNALAVFIPVSILQSYREVEFDYV
jgi:hypothetical protein